MSDATVAVAGTVDVAEGPSVHVALAAPSEFVVLLAGEMLPSFAGTAHRTVAPATAFPLASRTRTDSFWPSALPTVPVWESPAAISIDAGGADRGAVESPPHEAAAVKAAPKARMGTRRIS